MSRMTLQLMADPGLQDIADQAYQEAKIAAKATGTLITLGDVEQRIDELLDWRKRALKAEKKLRLAKSRSSGGDA